MFMAMAGAKMQHVPYRGAAPAITDLLGGQVQVIFDNMPSILQHVRARLRCAALAVTGTARSPLLPDVPVLADTIPGYEASALFGMGVPKNTPKEIIARLNKEINEVLAEPAIKAQAGRSRRRSADRHARSVRRDDRGRNRQVEEGDRGSQGRERCSDATSRNIGAAAVFYGKDSAACASREGDQRCAMQC